MSLSDYMLNEVGYVHDVILTTVSSYFAVVKFK